MLLVNLLAPKNFLSFAESMLPWLTFAFFLFMGMGLIGGLLLAPADYLQGDAFRIMYVHVPCAFLSLFVYCVMAVCAFFGLVWRLKLAFLIMQHSILIGAGFTFLALLTGSIWGRPMWGTWWIWDARLTSELILLFLYNALWLFHSAISHSKNADKLLAIFVLVGFIDIPIIHYSVYWWNTLHQGASFKLFAKPAIDTSMLLPLLTMIIAFSTYYAIMLILRIRYDLIVKQSRTHWSGENNVLKIS